MAELPGVEHEDRYGIARPEWPLAEEINGLDRFKALELIEFALDGCGVPKNDDSGVELGERFRFNWLMCAIEEAEGA